MTHYFGEPWDSPRLEGATKCPTPVGRTCGQCEEPILASDRGFIYPGVIAPDGIGWTPSHVECDLAAVVGHAYGVCRCCPSHRSTREDSREVLSRVNESRARAGLAPLF